MLNRSWSINNIFFKWFLFTYIYILFKKWSIRIWNCWYLYVIFNLYSYTNPAIIIFDIDERNWTMCHKPYSYCYYRKRSLEYVKKTLEYVNKLPIDRLYIMLNWPWHWLSSLLHWQSSRQWNSENLVKNKIDTVESFLFVGINVHG